MLPGLDVLLAVLSAAFYGIAAAFQHIAAEEEPPEHSLKLSLLVNLLKHPTWWLGNLFDLLGFLFQFIALRFGPLSLVEPVAVSNLIFALEVGSILKKRRPSLMDLSAAGITSLGIGLFISAAKPQEGKGLGSFKGWLLVGVIVTLLVLLFSFLSKSRSSNKKALLLAGASGMLLGFMAASIELSAKELTRGFVHALLTPAPYMLMVTGLLGILLVQSAFQAGELRFSLPLLTVLQPFVAILIGIFIMGEKISMRSIDPALELIGIGITVVGVIILGRGTESVAKSE